MDKVFDPEGAKCLADYLGLSAPTPEPEPELPEPKTAEQFAQAILNSKEYRASLERRIILDDLAPAVEIRLYDLAYGKPTEHVEVKDTTHALTNLTDQQLHDRAQAIAREQAQLMLTHKPRRTHEDDDAVH